MIQVLQVIQVMQVMQIIKVIKGTQVMQVSPIYGSLDSNYVDGKAKNHWNVLLIVITKRLYLSELLFKYIWNAFWKKSNHILPESARIYYPWFAVICDQWRNVCTSKIDIFWLGHLWNYWCPKSLKIMCPLSFWSISQLCLSIGE